MKTKDGIEITLTIGNDEMKLNFEDDSDDSLELEDEIYEYYRRSEDELEWCSIEQVISIFEKLIVFLYNGAVAVGHIKFQQEIKTLITELIGIYEKGITVMQQYKTMFCSVLKGEGKPENRFNMHHIFLEGFQHFSRIYVEVCDAHEKFTDLQKALDEAADLEQYNECIIENLQTTVACCIEGLELLCECGRKFLRKQLEKPIHKETESDDSDSVDLSIDISDVAFAFVAVERCEVLIEISERTVHNIKDEIHKEITVDMAKGTIRKIMSSIPALKSLFESHHEKFKKLRPLSYIRI